MAKESNKKVVSVNEEGLKNAVQGLTRNIITKDPSLAFGLYESEGGKIDFNKKDIQEIVERVMKKLEEE